MSSNRTEVISPNQEAEIENQCKKTPSTKHQSLLLLVFEVTASKQPKSCGLGPSDKNGTIKGGYIIANAITGIIGRWAGNRRNLGMENHQIRAGVATTRETTQQTNGIVLSAWFVSPTALEFKGQARPLFVEKKYPVSKQTLAHLE